MNHRPNFISGKSLVVIYWQELLLYSVYKEEPQDRLSAACTALLVHTTWYKKMQGIFGFVFLPTNWVLPCPKKTLKKFRYLLHIKPNKKPGWELSLLNMASTLPRWNKFKLLPEYVSPRLQLLCAQINIFYPLVHLLFIKFIMINFI